MEALGVGAGLAALGFWGFVGAAVLGGVWDGIRKREAQHETLRRIIESGQPIDPDLTNSLLSVTGDNKDVVQELKIAAMIMFGVAAGLFVLGIFMAEFLDERLMFIALGVGPLVGFIGAGLLAASKVVSTGNRDDVA